MPSIILAEFFKPLYFYRILPEMTASVIIGPKLQKIRARAGYIDYATYKQPEKKAPDICQHLPGTGIIYLAFLVCLPANPRTTGSRTLLAAYKAIFSRQHDLEPGGRVFPDAA